ncbi:unnamed protein product [Clonostachys chloroleuca]|uniref:chitin synthase n=1 Tax=Clonostachys chloroleuca TaxID=1926264 RepID=A0AA35MDH1_9HYPO|nr:unnamed protein product [Clonostachys chloroleuca]
MGAKKVAVASLLSDSRQNSPFRNRLINKLTRTQINTQRQIFGIRNQGKEPIRDGDTIPSDNSLQGTIPRMGGGDEASLSLDSYHPSDITLSRSSLAQTSINLPITIPRPVKGRNILQSKASLNKDFTTPCPKLGDGSDAGLTAYGVATVTRQNPPQSDLINDSAQPLQAQVDDTEAQKPDEDLQRRGKRKVTLQKYIITIFLVGVNFMLIFSTWRWARYYFIYLPLISFPLVLNCIMIASIIFFATRNYIWPEKTIEPDHIESMVMIMPCYNETLDECTRSLDSLVNQVGIESNQKVIMIICDGRVRGPGMAKTTAQYLNEDILIDQVHHEKISKAYTAWGGQSMDVEVSWGAYKGVPFYCIIKEQNQGKRDSLIIIRSFLYKYNIRNTKPPTIFSPRFFLSMTDWLSQEVKVNEIDHLIGMDADTTFEENCISELLKESKYPNTVGVCGYVAVDFKDGNWDLWSVYQSAEYTIAQGLRRLHQSIATKKVSCLPGCCQLLKICEMTCGDLVLIQLFGYYPKPLDGLIKRIRATSSEDRNHICTLLTTFPEAQTRQALRGRSYTGVPHSWSVFLSQRRRWTLGATSNDLLLVTSRHCQWWERILAFSNVLTWCLNVFVIASLGCMIFAFIAQPWWIIIAFASVLIIPLAYYITMAAWLPRSMLERAQYLFGLAIFVFCGPFLNIAVMIFAVINMDSFGWGKTRQVVADTTEEQLQGGSSSGDGGSSSTPVGEKSAPQ